MHAAGESERCAFEGPSRSKAPNSQLVLISRSNMPGECLLGGGRVSARWIGGGKHGSWKLYGYHHQLGTGS